MFRNNDSIIDSYLVARAGRPFLNIHSRINMKSLGSFQEWIAPRNMEKENRSIREKRLAMDL